jgi:hypothetical protein
MELLLFLYWIHLSFPERKRKREREREREREDPRRLIWYKSPGFLAKRKPGML